MHVFLYRLVKSYDSLFVFVSSASFIFSPKLALEVKHYNGFFLMFFFGSILPIYPHSHFLLLQNLQVLLTPEATERSQQPCHWPQH